MSFRRLYVLVVTAATAITPLYAAGASLGVAGSNGVATNVSTYPLNEALVTGTAVLTEDALVRTTTAPADLRLKNGARLLLATRSESQIGTDAVSLHMGAMRVAHFEDYPVHVRDLQISADTPAAEAVITRLSHTVEVASLNGSVRVSDGGATMTRVAAGSKVSFAAEEPVTPTRAAPAQRDTTRTGANPAGNGGLRNRDKKVLLWTIAAIAGAALALGSVALAQGKSL